jgi:hypothetical protein
MGSAVSDRLATTSKRCYTPYMHDTSAASRARYDALLRALTPKQRLDTVVRLNRSVRELALAGIDQAHPNVSPTRRAALLAERLYGKSVARRLYGAALDEES